MDFHRWDINEKVLFTREVDEGKRGWEKEDKQVEEEVKQWQYSFNLGKLQTVLNSEMSID